MSSLARRTLRTTAAAAGITAVGVGIASPAFAAPELPALPALPGLDAVTAPGLPSPDGLVGQLPPLPGNVSELPALFTFQGPTLNTAGPALPVPALPAPVAAIADPSGLAGQINAPALDPAQLIGQNNLAGLPSTGVLEALAGKALAGQALQSNTLGA